MKSLPPASGWASLNRRSYRRTSALTPSATPTQVMTPLTFTLSLPGVPLLVSGISLACTSVMVPLASFAAPVQVDDVAVFQAHLVAGEQADEALGRHFFKVAALDPHLVAELEAALAQLGQVRVHRGAAVVQRACAVQRVPVGEHQLHRVQHGHGARGVHVQVSRRQPSSVL